MGSKSQLVVVLSSYKKKERKKERKTDRQTERKKERDWTSSVPLRSFFKAVMLYQL